jgi:hypothetical protein
MSDSSDEKEKAIVAAPPVSWGDPPVKGARMRFCGQCGVPIWVAPSSQPLLNDGAELLCVPCGLARCEELAEHEEVKILAPPGSRPSHQQLVDEIAADWRRSHPNSPKK